MDRNTTFEEILKLVEQLTPLEKVRLIERVAPDIERELATGERKPSVSLLGTLKDLGPAPTTEEIDESRREMLANFPRDDI